MITLDDVRDSFITLDEARTVLAPLEAMGETDFEMGAGSISFDLPPEWNASLGEMEGSDLTEAKVSIDGKEFALTKDAVLGAGSLIGITRDYLSRTPGSLMEPHLNYYYGQDATHLNYSAHKGGSKNLKLIWRENPDVGVAFCRSALSSFSTDRILECVVDSLHDKYGTDSEILVDKRIQAGIRGTTVRLIVPESERSMASKFAEEEGNDPWSSGIVFTCSLTGDMPLSVAGFLLRYVCVNGATTEHFASAKHRRRRGEDLDEVYTWVSEETTQILGSIEGELSAVDALNEVKLEGDDIVQTMSRIYEEFRVPVNAREAITNQMVGSDDLSAYGLMQAVTESANDDDRSPAEVARLMSIGGSIPHVLSGRCPNCNRFSV